MIEILNYKNQNPSRLVFKFCKKELRGSSYFIPLRINKDQPILIKTPKLYMPFQPKFQTPESGYIRLSFDNFKIDSDVQLFYSFLKSTEKHLRNSLPNELKRKEFRSTIRESHPYSDYFNVNFETNNLKIYNIKLQSISLRDINGRFYAYFIIQLTGIYYNTKQDHLGVVWDLIQFKLDNPKNAIEECLFLDEIEESDQDEKIVRDHPKMASYVKMLNLGVPKFAVQQKMSIAGENPEYLDYIDKNIRDLPEILRKILEIDASISDNKNDESKVIPHSIPSMISLIKPNLLKEGLTNLKKVEKEDDSTLAKIKKRSGSIFPVPSLNQIKDALQNLKSLDESVKKADY